MTAGEDIAYRIEVTNNGPSTARNVTMADEFDSCPTGDQVTFLGWRSRAAPGHCFIEDFLDTDVRVQPG